MATGGGLGRVARHSQYHLSDGSISFLTSDRTLFRVHRSFFERESEFFRDLFASAAEDPHVGTDALPFTLDVTSNEFAYLLWVWYDGNYAYYNQSKDGWITILRLSTRWGFNQIKELAIREIDALQLSPAERISVYSSHGIDEDRLVSSYVELCKSPKITEADGNLLQMETLINVLQAREDAQRKARDLGHRSPTSACLEDDDLREIVSKFFRTGLSPRPSGTSTGSGAQASTSNGERVHGTTVRPSTITLNEPQIPGKKTQSTGGPPNTSESTGSEGQNSQGKGKGKEADNKRARERTEENCLNARTREEKEKQEKAREAKEKEAKEKVKNEEKEMAEKAKEKEQQNLGSRRPRH